MNVGLESQNVSIRDASADENVDLMASAEAVGEFDKDGGRDVPLGPEQEGDIELIDTDGGLDAAVDEEELRTQMHASSKDSKSSIPCASFNFINSILGAGVLGMAFAFKEAGFLMAIILLAMAALLTDYSCRLLIRVGVANDRYSYPSLVQRALGRFGFLVIGFFMFLTALGAMITYTSLVGSTVPDIMKRWIHPASVPPSPSPIVQSTLVPATVSMTMMPAPESMYSFFASSDFAILAFCGFVMLPLSLMRNVSSLGKFSALATASLLYIFFIIVWNTPGLQPGNTKPMPPIVLVNDRFFPALGIMAFAFVCQHNTFMLYGSLKNNTIRRWGYTSHASVGFAFVVLCGVGMFGYLAFSVPCVDGNVLKNLPHDIPSDIARAAAMFVLALTFPLECFVAREVCLDILRRSRFMRERFRLGSDEGAVPSSLAVHLTITLSLVFSSTLIGWLAGDAAGILLELTGGFSATAIAFILPALCALILDKESPRWSWPRLMPGVLLVFGTIAMLTSTIQTVIGLSTGESHSCNPEME